MTTYCVPDSITPRPIKPGVATVETIEAIMADGPCAILPVAGDCLEGVDVVDGGWVAVDFTRRPAPPRYRSKGGDGSSDLCLCYATFPGAPGPMVMYKEYQGVWGPWQMVGTRYKSMWEGGKLRLNCGMVAKRNSGPVVCPKNGRESIAFRLTCPAEKANARKNVSGLCHRRAEIHYRKHSKICRRKLHEDPVS